MQQNATRGSVIRRSRGSAVHVASAVALLVVALIPGARTVGAQPAAPLKVILDTDIGGDIDDAWALGFAMQSPNIDLVGVTIADQNTPARAKVACKLLHAGGRSEVPVAVGRRTGDHVEYQFAWAEDFTAKTPVAQPAAEFIVEMVRRHPGQITLVAVGPLQNVADALRRDPGIAKQLKRVVLMSGSIAASAWNAAAIPEWNVKAAIPDAQVVYSAGLPLTTVPLDSTTYVTLKDEERERLRKHDSPVTRSLEALYRLWIDGGWATRMTLHDQLAVAETVRPGAFFGRVESLPITVDDKGYTKVDRAGGKPAAVCFEPRRDDFMAFYLEGLMQSSRHPAGVTVR